MIYTDKVHLVADSLDELHEFARKIELHRCWFEGMKKRHPHYDLLNNNKKPLRHKDGTLYIDKVLLLGAKVVSSREILKISKSSWNTR